MGLKLIIRADINKIKQTLLNSFQTQEKNYLLTPSFKNEVDRICNESLITSSSSSVCLIPPF